MSSIKIKQLLIIVGFVFLLLSCKTSASKGFEFGTFKYTYVNDYSKKITEEIIINEDQTFFWSTYEEDGILPCSFVEGVWEYKKRNKIELNVSFRTQNFDLWLSRYKRVDGLNIKLQSSDKIKILQHTDIKESIYERTHTNESRILKPGIFIPMSDSLSMQFDIKANGSFVYTDKYGDKYDGNWVSTCCYIYLYYNNTDNSTLPYKITILTENDMSVRIYEPVLKKVNLYNIKDYKIETDSEFMKYKIVKFKRI